MKKTWAAAVLAAVLTVLPVSSLAAVYQIEDDAEYSSGVLFNLFTENPLVENPKNNWDRAEINGSNDWAGSANYVGGHGGPVKFGENSLKIQMNKNQTANEGRVFTREQYDVSGLRREGTDCYKAALSFWLYAVDDAGKENDFYPVRIQIIDNTSYNIQTIDLPLDDGTGGLPCVMPNTWAHFVVPLESAHYASRRIGGLRVSVVAKDSAGTAVASEAVLYLDNVQIIGMEQPPAPAVSFLDEAGKPIADGAVTTARAIALDFGTNYINGAAFQPPEEPERQFLPAYSTAGWMASAWRTDGGNISDALNGDSGSYWWINGEPKQEEGQWFSFNMGVKQYVAKLELQTGRWGIYNYPHKFKILYSEDGNLWIPILDTAGGSIRAKEFDGDALTSLGTENAAPSVTTVEFERVLAKHFKIQLTDSADYTWNISGIKAYDENTEITVPPQWMAVTDSSGACIPTDLQFDSAANRFVLQLQEPLQAGGQYMLTVNGVENICGVPMGYWEYPFETDAGTLLAVKNLTVTDESGTLDCLRASAEVENRTGTARRIVLVLAVYDGNTLVETAAEAWTIPSQQEGSIVHVECSGLEWNPSYAARAFVLDGWDTLAPLCETVEFVPMQ